MRGIAGRGPPTASMVLSRSPRRPRLAGVPVAGIPREVIMPKYLIQASITKEGISQVLSKAKGTGVREAVTKFAESAGGKIEAFYFSFGQYDVVAIADYPDNASAVAVSVAAGGVGAVRLTMTALVTPAEMDQAIDKGATLAVPGRL
jgi:uncharacterized protein with GYD domain